MPLLAAPEIHGCKPFILPITEEQGNHQFKNLTSSWQTQIITLNVALFFHTTVLFLGRLTIDLKNNFAIWSF
jgi:hypothetical protein